MGTKHNKEKERRGKDVENCLKNEEIPKEEMREIQDTMRKEKVKT